MLACRLLASAGEMRGDHAAIDRAQGDRGSAGQRDAAGCTCSTGLGSAHSALGFVAAAPTEKALGSVRSQRPDTSALACEGRVQSAAETPIRNS